MNRVRNSRKPGRSTPVIIILLMMVIGVGLFGIHSWEKRQAEQDAAQYADTEDERVYSLTMTVDDVTYKLNDRLDTYLLIGLDKFSNTLQETGVSVNNQQADFLLLMVVDRPSKSYSALLLNRDAMTEIQRLGMSGKKIGSFTGQLALAHTFGSGGKDSCRNTVQAVSHYLLDVPVEHYFSLTMDAIPVLNDLVGGVVVHIDDDFSAIDPTLVQGRDIRLWGQHALTFVRTRHYVDDSSNLSRMNRQQQYLNGLYTQLQLMLEEDGFGARLFKRMADYCVSDLTSDEFSALADRIKDYRFDGIRTISGHAVRGEEYMEFYTDEDALQQLVLELFFERKK